MHPISFILKSLLKQANLYELELARLTGIKQPCINRIISGKTPNPKIDTLRPIANFFGITVSQLIGEEPLFQNCSFNHFNRNTWHQAPLLEWKNILNMSMYNKNLNQIKFISIDCIVSKDTYALRVENSAMEPKFPINSILIIDPKLQPQDHDYVIVSLPKNSTPIFRKFLIEGELYYLKPLNPDFKTIFMEESPKFLGVVVQTKFNLRKIE